MCMAEQCIFWHLTSFFVDAPEPACDFLIFLSNHLYILCICLFSVVVHIVSLTFTFRDIHSHLTFSGLLFCSLFSSSFNSQYVCVCVLLSHFQIHASLTSSFFCFFSLLRIASPSSLFLNPTSIFLHTFVHILLCISAPLSPTYFPHIQSKLSCFSSMYLPLALSPSLHIWFSTTPIPLTHTQTEQRIMAKPYLGTAKYGMLLHFPGWYTTRGGKHSNEISVGRDAASSSLLTF